MQNDQNENQCAHTGCNCTVPSGEKYCSPHCETVTEELLCGCGHAGCVAREPADRAWAALT